MEDNYQKKKVEYGFEKQSLSTKMDTINQSINQLKTDVKKVTGTIEQMHFAELEEKMDDLMSKQDKQLTDDNNEVAILKGEILQLKEQLNIINEKQETTTKQRANPKVSEYRQLQNMLKQSSAFTENGSNIARQENKQGTIQPISGNQNRSFMHPQDTVITRRGKSSYQSSQPLNKNTTIRSPKSQKRKSNPALYPKQESEEVTKNTSIQSNTNLLQQQRNKETKADPILNETKTSENSGTETPLANTNTNQAENQYNQKNKSSSLFSLFK